MHSVPTLGSVCGVDASKSRRASTKERKISQKADRARFPTPTRLAQHRGVIGWVFHPPSILHPRPLADPPEVSVFHTGPSHPGGAACLACLRKRHRDLRRRPARYLSGPLCPAILLVHHPPPQHSVSLAHLPGYGWAQWWCGCQSIREWSFFFGSVHVSCRRQRPRAQMLGGNPTSTPPSATGRRAPLSSSDYFLLRVLPILERQHRRLRERGLGWHEQYPDLALIPDLISVHLLLLHHVRMNLPGCCRSPLRHMSMLNY